MAITKLVSATTPNPTAVGTGGDWELAMAQLTACKQILNGQNVILSDWTGTTLPSLKKGAYIQHLGAVYVVDTEDYALPAVPADGDYFLVLTTSGDTLTASWVTDVSNFAWDAIHNGMYDATDSSMQRTMFGVRATATATIFKKFRILAYSNIIVFGDGTIDSLSGFINILTPASIAGDLSIAGGLVVNSPTILAGGLTVQKYLSYGTTYIEIPTIDDLPVLGAGDTNVLAGISTSSNLTSSKTLTGITKSPFTFRTVLNASVNIYLESWQPASAYMTVTTTVTLKVGGVVVASTVATKTQYGTENASAKFSVVASSTSGAVDITCSVGSIIEFIVTIAIKSYNVDMEPPSEMVGSGAGSYTGFNCDRALNTIAGETLSLV